MQRVMITVPENLLYKTDQMAKKLGQNRSEFIRQALQTQLEIQRRKEFEALLAEGYQEMAEQAVEWGEGAQAGQFAAAEGLWVWDE